MVEIAVIDTGIGIPPEERERVFERFYQVDSSVRRRYKGTGLGLTICKHIVTQHGGRIWVEDLRQDAGRAGMAQRRHMRRAASSISLCPKCSCIPRPAKPHWTLARCSPAAVGFAGAS